MLSLIYYLIVLCVSQCMIDTTIDNVTTLSYVDNVECSYLFANYTSDNSTYAVFKSESTFLNEEIIVNFIDFPGIVDGSRSSFYFGHYSYSAPNLQTIKILLNNVDDQILETLYINNNTHFYTGCFQNENGCSSIDIHSISIYSNDFTVFHEYGAENYNKLYYYNDNSINSNKYPYVFLCSINSFTFKVYFSINEDYYNFDYFKSLSGSFYLLTSFNVNVSFFDFIDSSADSLVHYYSGFEILSVCSRKDTNRYVMFHENHTLYTNCSCWSKNNETEMDQTTLFNYPDCNYNSSMFDLILPFSSNTYSLSDDLLEWYSIIFTTSGQSIEINDGNTLIIDILNINQDDISFNGNIDVDNLTISTPGASFNVLNFTTINYSSISENNILFYVQSTPIDLELFNLLQCGTIIAKTSATTCNCYYSGVINEYYDENNVLDSNCNLSREEVYNYQKLIINSNEYSLSSNEYWYSLTISLSALLVNGGYHLTSNYCYFESKTIKIVGNLYCKTMNINSNTKLIVSGELSIDALVITGNINNNLNENGIIESYESIEITTIEITQTQSNCFELISSNYSLSQPSINSEYLTLLLSQNHLLRICPSSSTNYEVECTTIGNSFDLLHCPCIDENCIINVNTTQLDTRNIEFNGLFNIVTNSTIVISDQTTSITIYINDIYSKLLLIGGNSLGFNQSNTKQESVTIQTSTLYPCNALLIENDKDTCIICNAINNINGYCTDSLELIDNCQLQNEYGCEICYEGYQSNVTNCKKCLDNCLRCYNGECVNCEMNYHITENGECEVVKEPIIMIENNKAMKCNDGYYSSGECIKCLDDNCITCNSSHCLTCNNSFILTNGNCQANKLNNGEEIISNYGVIDCNASYYSNNSQCIDCSLTFDNCKICNINGCLNCNSGYVLLNDNSCSINTNCLNIDNSICLSCNDKGSWFNGNECEKCGDNCKNCINGYCIECNDGYILQSENNCIENEYSDNCITLSYYGTCQRCSDRYYLNNNLCYECSNECTTCYNLTYCFECNDGYMLNDNNECVNMSELNANCKTAIPGSSGGCAICNVGYYRNQTSCHSCITNCNKCNNGESCLICESNYFLLNDASECISYDDLTNCETKTQSGCTKCINDNYHLNNQYCISCSDTTENCNTCNNNGECLTCQNDYVLINYECINYQLIDNCKESSNSKCISCSFWHTLNSDQTGCDTQVVWWVIVLIVLFILIILIGICVLLWYVTKLLFVWKKPKTQENVTIFSMSRSNIQFESTNNKDIVINKDEILFNDESEEIEVNEETRDLICVGNTSKHTIKVQFSVKDGCDKYEIRTNPQLITIQKGKAIEFEIFIKPLCTCKINDQIMLISVDLTKGKTITTPITINTITIMTTRLDYSELIEDIKLGEGSFGIVYKGTFRGHQVAIKKLKQAQDDQNAIEEFNKEVTMLDKFRNDYIIHFYGAVFIPTKICMVTEFAQYGSLQDLMKKQNQTPPKYSMKLKILLDCSKGISYLHSNGILHRDIKPDNFLILTLENDFKVNAKLTDFGSSRNINMLMTNMTFTKGVGSPAYMAPEALQQNKYKKSADIYSFAITMYETIIWNEAYPKDKFRFPWKIAEFIVNGERLPKPDTMNDSMYSLIDNCWKHDLKERYEINQIITNIEEMN